MPIKFRCQHCQQLMGISRKKVGQVVDCPKCGRSVRVPIEDGVSQPAPEPEWNLEDPALSKALDELGAIGKKTGGTEPPAAPPAPPAPIVPPTPPVVQDPPKPVEVPRPVPPPYVPPAPQAYTPPPKNANHQESIAGSWYIPDASESESDEAPSATPSPAAPAYSAPAPSYSPPAAAPSFTPIAMPQAAAAAPGYQPIAVGGLSGGSSARPSEPVSMSALAEMASRPAAIPARPTRAAPVAAPAPKPTSTIVVVLITMVATGLVGLGIAYAAGLFSGGRGQNIVEPATPDDGDGTASATNEPAAPKNVAVTGQVTYVDDSGKKRHDVGARVLILPVERNGTVTLPSSGLGPVDGTSDFLIRRKLLREVGGDAAIVNHNGAYELRLPGSAGDFQVIAVSKRQGRKGDVPESIGKIMTDYFGEDSHILSSHACDDKRVHYDGKEGEVINFEFESPSP